MRPIDTTLVYFCFTGYLACEPRGGMKDLDRRLSDRGEAIAYCEGYLAGQGGGSWAHVWSLDSQEIIWEGKGDDL